MPIHDLKDTKKADRDRTSADMRLIPSGLIGPDRAFGADPENPERKIADAWGVGQHANELHLLVDSIGTAKATIERDDTLSQKGRNERRLSVGTEALRTVTGISAPVIRKAAKAIDAALENDVAASIKPIPIADVMADHRGNAGGRLDDTFFGRDLNARLTLARSELLRLADTKPSSALLKIVSDAAEAGDSIIMAGIDTMPACLRDRVLHHAGIDDAGWSRRRRSYRTQRDPIGAGRLQAMIGVAQRIVSNTLAGRAAVERAGLLADQDAKREFDNALEPLRDVVQRTSA